MRTIFVGDCNYFNDLLGNIAGMKSSMTLDFGGNFKNLESSIKSLLETSRAETDYFL